MFAPIYTAFVVLFLSIPVFAAAPVSDIGDQKGSEVVSQPGSATTNVVVPQVSPMPAQAPANDSYYQMQLLQDEVRTLRGMIEELNNEIRQLKKRQMDDYMDLDRRLSALLSGQASSPVAKNVGANVKNSGVKSQTTNNKPSNSTVAQPSPSSTTAERDQYNQAYEQLKAGKVADAVTQFKAHIAKYPNGRYVANAHYWLGEIYVLQNQLESARQSFTTVVEKYPAHRKAPDSTFKLGQVYFMMGNKSKAKEFLDKAAAGTGNAARLATSYLEENF